MQGDLKDLDPEGIQRAILLVFPIPVRGMENRNKNKQYVHDCREKGVEQNKTLDPGMGFRQLKKCVGDHLVKFPRSTPYNQHDQGLQ